jgi:hypothetical protein
LVAFERLGQACDYDSSIGIKVDSDGLITDCHSRKIVAVSEYWVVNVELVDQALVFDM